VKWLWYPYIPFGRVTLLQGDPGDGKSKLMLSVAALLSKGEALPFTTNRITAFNILNFRKMDPPVQSPHIPPALPPLIHTP
jgi:hypothetical protein